MVDDETLRLALGDLKTDVRLGFADTNKRLDDLVTKGEFNATIERVDVQHENLRREFDTHVNNAEAYMQHARDSDNRIMEEATKAVQAVRQEVHSSLEGYRISTRWAIGLAASVAGLIVAAASVLVSIFIK